MNAVVVYLSKFGNTKRIAETVAGTLKQAGQTRVFSIEQFAADDLHDADLVVLGSPTHYQAVPKAVRSFLKTLPRHSLKGKCVAAYDTSLKMRGPIMLLTAAHGVMARLRKLGGSKVVRPETFIVKERDSSSEGEIDLLCNGEMERVREWAHAILRGMK